MKTLAQYILSNMKFDKITLLEKQGIFNGCEDIANELVKLIVKETKKGIEENINTEIAFNVSKYNPIFRDDIIINIKYKFIKSEKFTILADTSFDEENLFKYDTGRLALSQEEVNKLESKPYKIDIEANIEEINLYDLKGILMHELTHFYTAILFYNKKENYFDRTYYKPDDWENDSEYLLYFVQQDEVNSWVTEMKSELDRIKTKGFDNVFNELKETEIFKKIMHYKDIFNQENKLFSFKENDLKDYPNLYRKHFNTKDNDNKIYLDTKHKINKAYNQLYRTVVKMCYEYKGDKDFIYNEFGEETFKPWKYLEKYNKRRVSGR